MIYEEKFEQFTVYKSDVSNSFLYVNFSDPDRFMDGLSDYAMNGYQLRNATSGSQGKGKKDISDNPTKGYLEGLHNGYQKAQKEIAHLFKLHLDCTTKKNPPTKLQEKAMAKFEEFIERGEDDVC